MNILLMAISKLREKWEHWESSPKSFNLESHEWDRNMYLN